VARGVAVVHPEIGEAALADLDALLRSFAGATETTIGIVDARVPAFP
jgi:hypothetical protein